MVVLRKYSGQWAHILAMQTADILVEICLSYFVS